MRNSRLIGGKPKIGIRPIIDGRRGGTVSYTHLMGFEQDIFFFLCLCG